MKRKLLLPIIVFLAIMSIQVYAQNGQGQSNTGAEQKKSYTYSMKEMWYASVGGGPNLLMANQDGAESVGDRMRYGGEISLGKWFNPGFGARVQFYAGKYRGFNYSESHGGTFTYGDGTNYYPPNWFTDNSQYKHTSDGLGFWQDFSSVTAFLDFTVNIGRMIKGYEHIPGHFDAIGFVGVGLAHNKESLTNPTTTVPGARFGGRINYHIQKGAPFSIYVEGNGTFFPEKYDGYIGDRGFDTNANVMLGVQYQFNF